MSKWKCWGKKRSLPIPPRTHFRHHLSSTSSSYCPVTAPLPPSPYPLPVSFGNNKHVASDESLYLCSCLIWELFLLFCLCLSTERAVDMKWQKYVIRHIRAKQQHHRKLYRALSKSFLFVIHLSPVCFNHFSFICLLFFHSNVRATWVQFRWAQQLEARLHATVSFCTGSSGCRASDSSPPGTHSGKSTCMNSASISIHNIYMPLYAVLFYYCF